MPFGAFDGIAQAIEIFLPYIADVCKVCDFSDLFKVTILSCPVETVFKFIGLVEMIFNRMLVSACYDQYVVNSCRDRLLNKVLEVGLS